MSTPLITPELVSLDANLGSTKTEVITSVAGLIAAAERADADGLAHDALDRESKSPTGMPGGFAIPHCRSAAVSQVSLGFARLSPAVDFNGPDGPADLIFMIAASEDGGADHMKLLTKLARALVNPEFVEQLRQAPDAQTVVDLIGGVVEPKEEASTSSATALPAPGHAAVTNAASDTPRIVAITACPTGIAHTYMAADYLRAAGKKLGVDVKVEPQGSTATEPLSTDDIEGADAVIFATDVGVKGRERFAGKPVIESGVKRAVDEPEKMISEAVAASKDPHAHRVPAGHGEQQEPEQAGSHIGWGKRIQQALMTGVSYMIPFVAAGGLLIALGFLFGGYEIAKDGMDIALHNTFSNLPTPTAHALGGSATMTYIGAVLFAVGQAAFGFLLPALAGYIGFGLADRPGIAPGFVAGAVAGVTGAGFIGAIIGGLLGGFVAYWFTRLNPPRWLRGLMPVVIIPLVGSLVAGGLMYVVLGRPLAALTNALNNWLGGMSGASAVILGIVLGLMMCSDLGGPINKAAYLFATTNLAVTNVGSLKVMAAVMAAGMVPPLAMALSTTLRPKLYQPAERENGTAAWLLGASFISEGAIPFAAADPLRVIPSMMVGGAITGALSMALGAASKAPHGGIFVFFAIDRVWAFILAIVVGTLVAALLVTALKASARRKAAAAA
ncbi:putative ATP synthase F0, A subunit [Cutibacterium acnes HL053PA2]|uniref:PTS fructose transporter subunit IIABC n=1 Tax=Cutibacterium acnes TaxID=1747 RepID=UPI0001C4D969|nr:fructose-specific PTS transporter subunit EIIC [Cutibacterium acnes]OFO87765.1 PTS lactose transporter subunit IIC [Propionibacterium sp. HMSC062D05]EFD03843.1 putative ATP synthase F0, A subunit [Cutibacterium acnes SK187]EFS40828.1 putative ATP synthase F0, A subunit [Cutibacterium acnes HL110PA1]EFS44592.1 putative ATP synthase F0, A subunit [Cutibacterium acnes HL110PA2]EFT08220.1 putative ATP synthase F0, A subunit [Cutibacterium acnes HL082PA1]